MDSMEDEEISNEVDEEEASNNQAGPTLSSNLADLPGDIPETSFSTAPICLVLSEDVQKTFATGDPLIVGNSMADIQIFFQKVIYEAGIGKTQRTPKSAQSNRSQTIKIENMESEGYLMKGERYPIPYAVTHRKLKGEEDDERCEIPLDAIRLYLSERKYYPGWTANSKRNLRKRCDDFKLEGDILMYKTRKGGYVQCVEDRAERMRILWQQHSIDHRRRDRLFSALKEKYYWKGMLTDINKMLASCEFCTKQRQEKVEHDKTPKIVENKRGEPLYLLTISDGSTPSKAVPRHPRMKPTLKMTPEAPPTMAPTSGPSTSAL